MSNRFDLITQYTLGKDVDDCSVEELQHLAEKYPYFAPAQFALLKKLKRTNHSSYITQVQKAILYYHDPLAFDYFINKEHYEQAVDVAPLQEEPAVPETTHTHLPETAVTATEDEQIAKEVMTEPTREQAEPVVEAIKQEPEPPVASPLAAPEKPATPQETVLAFEPYHTVDYFASQGIRLSQEEATKDRFGKQLKSFTEWLKTMKKLPAAEQIKNLDTRTEKKVETMAAHSIEGADVVTESMAEVWAKQGNKEKALEIYQQLSLLNPSKKAYFAAKIDSLK